MPRRLINDAESGVDEFVDEYTDSAMDWSEIGFDTRIDLAMVVSGLDRSEGNEIYLTDSQFEQAHGGAEEHENASSSTTSPVAVRERRR